MTDHFSTHTETVKLPSCGLVYPKSLGVGDSIMIKPFSNKDMKGIYANADQTGIEVLLENCVNQPHPNWTVQDLIPADRDMLLIRLRSITLGSILNYELVCSSCGEKFDYDLNIDSILVNYLSSETPYPFHITLPDSKKELLYHILSYKEIKNIEKMLDEKAKKFPKFQKKAERVFYNYAKKISFADGSPSYFQNMYDFYSDLSAYDASYLIYFDEQINIGPVLKQDINCPHCGSEQVFEFTLGSSFFRPKFNKPASIGITTTSPFQYNAETDDDK